MFNLLLFCIPALGLYLIENWPEPKDSKDDVAIVPVVPLEAPVVPAAPVRRNWWKGGLLSLLLFELRELLSYLFSGGDNKDKIQDVATPAPSLETSRRSKSTLILVARAPRAENGAGSEPASSGVRQSAGVAALRDFIIEDNQELGSSNVRRAEAAAALREFTIEDDASTPATDLRPGLEDFLSNRSRDERLSARLRDFVIEEGSRSDAERAPIGRASAFALELRAELQDFVRDRSRDRRREAGRTEEYPVFSYLDVFESNYRRDFEQMLQEGYDHNEVLDLYRSVVSELVVKEAISSAQAELITDSLLEEVIYATAVDRLENAQARRGESRVFVQTFADAQGAAARRARSPIIETLEDSVCLALAVASDGVAATVTQRLNELSIEPVDMSALVKSILK